MSCRHRQKCFHSKKPRDYCLYSWGFLVGDYRTYYTHGSLPFVIHSRILAVFAGFLKKIIKAIVFCLGSSLLIVLKFSLLITFVSQKEN